MEKSSAPKRIAVGFNVVIQILLAAVILAVVNLAIERWHPPKIDLARTNYYALSDKTRQLLNSLKSPVEVIVFFQPVATDAVTLRIFEDIQNLLKEYEETSRQIKVRYIDPDKDLLNAEKLAREYDVKDPNVVVFVHDKRSKFVKALDLVEFDHPTSPFAAQSDRIKAFKGEQLFTSAIQNVIDPKQPKVYFLEGQGEGDLKDSEPKKGYSEIASYIQQDNLVVEQLNIFQSQQIPADCDVMVICGPEKPFSDVELKAIQDYLAKNGRLMVLLDGMRSDTDFEKLLSDYGVKVGNDVIMIKIRDSLGGELLITSAPGNKFASHPITQSLKNAGLAVLFPMARSIDRVGGPLTTQQRVTVLVETPAMAWGETDLVKLQQEKAQFDDKDRKGPVPMAVAVEPQAAGEMEREGMRMVVFGSSSFIRNGSLKLGNADLFMGALNWLLKRQQLIGIASKKPQEFALTLDVFQQRTLFAGEVVALPLAVAIIGLMVWLKRRK